MSKNFVKIKGVAEEAWHLIDVQLISNVMTNRDGSRRSTVYLMDAAQTKLHSSWDVPAVADAIHKVQAEDHLGIKKLKGELKTLRTERDHFKLLYEAAKNPKSFPVHSKFNYQHPESLRAEDMAADLEPPVLNEEIFDKELDSMEMWHKSGELLRDKVLGQVSPERFSAWLYSIFLLEVKMIDPTISEEDWRYKLREDIRLGKYVNAVIGERFIELMRYDGKKSKITVDFYNISKKPNNPEI